MRAALLLVLCACSGGAVATDGGSTGGGSAGVGGGTAGGTGGGMAGGSGGGSGGGTAGGSAGGIGGGGGSAGGAGGGSVVAIDAGTWTSIPSFPAGVRQETAVAELGGKVYVAGGFVMNGGIVARVEVFDPADGGWSTAADLPKPVHHANMAAVNGKLYVVGALETLAFTALTDVWEFTPGATAWVTKAPLPNAQRRGGSGVAVVNGKIYVVGGLRGGVAVNDFTAYDPVANTHEALPAVPTARDHLVAGSSGTTVFAIGGRGGGITTIDGRVDAYDTVAKTWSPKAPMLTPRGGCAIGAFPDYFVVAGGEGAPNSSGVFPNVEAYFPATNTWQALAPMKTPRHGTGGAVVDGVFYVPGGATVQAFGATAVCEVWRP